MNHGGLLSYTNTKLTDFSSNINPLGIPKKVKIALFKAIPKLQMYPDIQYTELKKITASYLNCEPNNVLLGNGAVEIVDNFCAAFNRIIICPPCFSEYELRAQIRNKEILSIPQTDNFLLNIETLEKNITEGDLLILGNPNNPTGLRIEKNILLQIYKTIKLKNAFLLLDEAFFEFCNTDYDSINLFKKEHFTNVCIIRAATKFFALPGIRLAYSCTAKETVKRISSFEQPWHINILAEAAASIIFNDADFISKSKAYMHEARTSFFKALKQYGKTGSMQCIPYKSDCNFILLKLLNHTDIQALRFFEKKNILVRTCSSFSGLGNKHIRIAVKSKDDNKKFIEALK